MDQRILFRLTTKRLIVANTGTVFSKEGLKSIVYTDTSSKISKQKTFPDSKKQAQEHISTLIHRKCHTFKDLDELASANGTDRRTAGDYSERLLLELLQNAIDAGGGEQIGNKGIGFRSVLNGINIIEIHSGHYHVRWSDRDAKKTLEQNQIDTKDKKLPLLALPTWCENKDGEIQTLLNDGYNTVVRLTLTERGVNSVKEEWKQFSNDPSLLLFINNSIELKWEREGYPQIQWNRSQTGEIVTVEIKENGKQVKIKNWRQFQSDGAIAAYLSDKERRFKENKDGNPLLYSFFPAALSPHPFPNLYLHHCGFDLQSNRQAVNIDEDDQCLKDLSKAIIKTASSMENESDFLDLLKLNRHPLNQDEETESKIWENVLPQLAKKEFKGIGDRRLVDMKSCPKNEDMPYSMRDEKRWRIWEAFLSALESMRPNGLFDLCVFQSGTENKQREETLLHFNPDSPFTKKEIQKLSWAPVESSDHAVSSSKIKIFLPSEKPIQRPPDDIEVRFLTSDFLEIFKNKDDDAISFLKVVLGVYDFSAIGVIEHCVLPKLDTTQKHGASKELIEFLKSLKEADPKEAKASVDYFDWENPVRSELARNLYLKCQEKNWPVIHVYVDRKWTGNNFLENVYGVDRGFLEFDPPENKNEDEKKTWENFWKWLGVGWCPKVMPLLESIVCKTRDHQGLIWNDTTKIFQGIFFGGNPVPDNWPEYCNALILKKKDSDIFERTPRIKKNWTIDGGHKLLKTQDAFHIICSNWQVYEKWMSAVISYSGNKRNDDDNHKTDLPSYFLWLIQTIPWVPCDDGAYYEGYKVFLENSQVVRKIPQFVNVLNMSESDDDRQEKDPFREDFIKKCGIRSKWKEVEDSDWEAWLIKASEMKTNNENNSDHRETIRLMYRSLIDHRKMEEGNQWRKQPVQPIKKISLWGIEYPGDKNEKWHLCDPTSLPYFVDRGDFADIGLPGLYLFPVRLDGLSKKVKTHFGLFSLSDKLIGKPLYEGELCPQFTLKAGERINELVAYLRVDNKKYIDEEFIKQINSLSVSQVNGLKVKFFIDGSDLGDPIYQKKYRRKNQDNSWTIFFDESGCSDAERWEFFSETLLLSCGSDMDKEANIRDLLQYSLDELHGKMLRLGVAPETIEDLKRKKESDQKPEETHIPPPQEEPDTPHPKPVPPPITLPPPGDSGLGDISDPPKPPSGGKDVPPNRPHPEKGMEAQHWLFNEVKKWCRDQGQPTPLEEQQREDITIPLNPPIIIEVKRIKGKTVFWSQKQIEKAFSYKNRGYPRKYTIALVDPNRGTNEVYWVIDPLLQLQSISERKIQWRWTVEPGKNYNLGSWDQPETPPQKISDRYSAVIPVDTEWIRKLPKGISRGLELIVNG
jgi:hypothetical protein